MKIVIIILSMILLASAAAETTKNNALTSSVSFFKNRADGWFWYIDPPPQDAVNKDMQESNSTPVMLQKTSKDILQEKGEAMEEALAKATLNPTEENLVEYMRKNMEIVAMSQTVANRFKQVLRVTPEFDYSLVEPREGSAIVIKNIEDRKHRNNELADIAETKGLVFFFKSDCPFCHRMAPVLKEFAEKYGFHVMAFSLDGGELPAFPAPLFDNELAKTLKVNTVPALFVVDPLKNSVSLAGFGFQNLLAIEENVLAANNAFNDGDGAVLGGVSKEINVFKGKLK